MIFVLSPDASPSDMIPAPSPSGCQELLSYANALIVALEKAESSIRQISTDIEDTDFALPAILQHMETMKSKAIAMRDNLNLIYDHSAGLY